MSDQIIFDVDGLIEAQIRQRDKDYAKVCCQNLLNYAYGKGLLCDNPCLSHVPNLCNLPNLRRIGICNMKRLEQMPTLNRELESLDVEKNVPMLGVDSFRDVTPINLPNLKWIRINLGNDVKSNMILDRFKNICETTRW